MTIVDNGTGISIGQHGKLYSLGAGSMSYAQTKNLFYADIYWLELADSPPLALSIVAVDSKPSALWIIADREAVGTNGMDLIAAYGAGVVDVVRGLGGSDALYGWSRNDFLIGGGGNDLRVGEYGSDTLIGGKGADIFSLTRRDVTDDDKRFLDVIRDFSAAEGDSIDLSAIFPDLNDYTDLVRLVARTEGAIVEVLLDGEWRQAAYLEGFMTSDLPSRETPQLAHSGLMQI